MRLKLLFLFFSVVAGIYTARSQQSEIIFTSDEDCKFVIYKPIDGFYNSFYPTDTVVLRPESEFIYRFAVDDWGVVKCTSQTKLPMGIFIEKDSIVRVHNTKDSIRFEGSNAAANELLYNSLFFCRVTLASIIDSLYQTKDSSIIEAITHNTRLLPQATFLYNGLDSLFADSAISEKCYNYSTKEIDYLIKFQMMGKFTPQISSAKPMSDTIKNYISLIGETFFDDEKITSYCLGQYITGFYCQFLFNQLDNAAKNSLREGYSKETFGPYSHYLLLHKELTKLSLFFDAFILQYQFNINEFGRVEMYNYLKSKYPQSEAVQIIGKLVENELNDIPLTEPVFLDRDSIANFSDFGKIEGLQNKYLFIDLWASWCLPCRAEFTHNKKLNALFSNYANIEKIYISIDEKENSWKEAIKALRLSGYNLLASEKLVAFIKKEIYNSNAISIPRYLLLDTGGNVLDGELSHPNDIENLQKQLDKHLIRKE